MYEAVKVHIPKKTYEKLKGLVVKDKGMPIKFDLIDHSNDLLLLTPGQII